MNKSLRMFDQTKIKRSDREGPELHKRMLRTASAFLYSLVLFCSTAVSASALDTAEPYVCDKTQLHQWINKDICIFVAQDNSLQPGGYTVNPWVNECYWYAGTGGAVRDSLEYVYFVDVKNNGRISAGGLVNIAGSFSHPCRSSKDAYKLKVKLVSPTGATLESSKLKTSYTEPKLYWAPLAGTYCYSHRCGSTKFSTSVAIPANAVPGSYSLRVEIESAPDTLGLGLEDLKGVAIYSDRLTLPPNTVSISDWSADFAIDPKSKSLECALEPTPADEVDAYGITMYEWRIMESKSKKVIDKFNVPEPFNLIGAGNQQMKGQISLTKSTHSGQLLRYQFRDAVRGKKYICEVRAVSPSATSPWDSADLVAKFTFKNFKR